MLTRKRRRKRGRREESASPRKNTSRKNDLKSENGYPLLDRLQKLW
jgi:hypothetical protein